MKTIVAAMIAVPLTVLCTYALLQTFGLWGLLAAAPTALLVGLGAGEAVS